MNQQPKIVRTALALLIGCAFVGAQSANKPAPLPIAPLLVEYEYAPLHLQQWLSGHPRYTLIEAVVAEGERPALEIILTEKDARRVWYANTEARIKSLVQTGKEAHLAAIDCKVVPGEGGGQVYGLAFRDKHGQAVRWRFIPASVPSERGAGLTPLAAAPGLRLDYRDLGTLAGEGTATQFDDRLFEADPWPERSAPPYFSAYRGSITLGRHSGVFAPGAETWRVIAAPGELREDAEWRLANEHGRERRLRVRARKGDEAIIQELSGDADVQGTLELTLRVTPEGVALRALRLSSRARAMRLSFSPEFQLNPRDAAEVAWQVDQGEQRKIAHGVARAERSPDGVRWRWRPEAPDWARAKAWTTMLKLAANGYAIESSFPAK
jgi:hypothetical protein